MPDLPMTPGARSERDIAERRAMHARNTRRNVGWVYPELNWFRPEEAENAGKMRDGLVASLVKKGVHLSAKGTKLSTGDLSPGCMRCGEGTWSCLKINSACTAKCFFCPQDRAPDLNGNPIAAEVPFECPETYIAYLEDLGFQGVGITGGEPALSLDTTLRFIEKIKDRFGSGIYVWLYSNGDAAAALSQLRSAGLDEIRFNIAGSHYDLRAVELARQRFDQVVVEVPAIPEDLERLKSSLAPMQSAGVCHLNVHQLLATRYNYRALAARRYTFLHYPSDSPVPVFESEIAALRLLEYAIDNRAGPPVNYCSQIYKWRFQNAGARTRAAGLGAESYEEITEPGYVRRVTIGLSNNDLATAIGIFRERGVEEGLWIVDHERRELSLRGSLLGMLHCGPCDLAIRYFEVHIGSYGGERSEASGGTEIEKKLISLVRAQVRPEVLGAVLAGAGRPGAPVESPHTDLEAKLWDSLGPWERIEEGLGDVF